MSAVATLPRASDDTVTQLREARVAYRAKLSAETTLSRLARYTHLTAGMKHDRRVASERKVQAEATLQRVLGGAK